MPDTPYRIPGHPTAPLAAGADLSSNQFRFVKAGATEGQVVAIAAATDIPIALQLDKPNAAAKPGEFVQFGIYEIEAGAAVSYGDRIQTDAQGRAITAVATGYPVGRALQAAANAGERIACFINTIAPSVF